MAMTANLYSPPSGADVMGDGDTVSEGDDTGREGMGDRAVKCFVVEDGVGCGGAEDEAAGGIGVEDDDVLADSAEDVAIDTAVGKTCDREIGDETFLSAVTSASTVV